ncbi:MAG: Hpt domain-containing protein [Rhodothermales bacterium]|nr:Hpt domain-containing protein [Rhodothermales bacterium]
MDDHFAKPFRRTDFSLLLQSWLRPMDGPAESDEAAAEAGGPIEDEVLSKLNEYRTFMGDDGIREIASDFGPSGRRYVRKMRRAYAERRWPDVGATAHALCGLSLNISATRLAGACRKIESASNDGSIEEARPLFDIVESEVDRVDDLLNRHVL